jgi:Phage P22-like portal protein
MIVSDADVAQKAEPKRRRKQSKTELHKEALKRFKASSDADYKQRKHEKDDLRFQVPELQWDDDAKRSRLGDAIAGIPVPPRPILSISKIDQPIQLVLNQERQAHLGVNIHPLSPDASDETADVLEGIYRQIERDSQAEIARTWAFARAVMAGRGAYRINTKYDDMAGHPRDQVITIERLLYQDAVYWDPASRKPDFSDANYAFITEWTPLEEFKREYPKASIVTATDQEFADLCREEPYWIQDDGEKKAVLLAEYFYVEYEEKTYVALLDGQDVPEDEVTDEDQIDDSVPKYTKSERVVQWCKLSAGEILEEAEWNGHYIPIITVIGRELIPFDTERRWMGMIGPAKDSQRGYNYAVSNAIEIAALEPKAPFIGAKGAFEGFEANWQQANQRNYPYLEYNPTSDRAGQPNPPPARTPIDASRLTVSMELARQFSDGIQATMSTFDPSIGMPGQEKSGKALTALQGQADQSNSHFLHNMAQISMAYEARVVLDLIPAIYDRPGRIVRVLDDEDESDAVMLNQPHYIHPITKRPIPASPNIPPPPAGPNGAGPAQPKTYDLRKGGYGADISIGKSWQSRLEQGSEEIGQILQAQPNLMPIIGPLYFKFRDFPGSSEIADLLKKVREKQFPGLDDDGTGIPSPEAAQAQIQALQSQVKQMQQALQAAAMEKETETVKHQAMITKAQLEAASRERIATEKNTIDLMIAKMDNLQKTLDSALLRGHEKEQQFNEMAHDVGMAGAQAIHAQHAQALAPQVPTEAEPPFAGPNPEGMGGETGI